MRFRILRLLAAIFAMASLTDRAHATLVGSTYDFTISKTGTTVILGGTNGLYTDPSDPGFCIGPASGCVVGSGVTGAFSFANVTPTLATIKFNFSGSTKPATGSFSVDLTGITGIGGARITNASRASGNLIAGSNFNVSSFGANYIDFIGTPSSIYDALGGAVVVFNVTEAVSEPASIAMLGAALFMLAAVCRRRWGG